MSDLFLDQEQILVLLKDETGVVRWMNRNFSPHIAEIGNVKVFAK